MCAVKDRVCCHCARVSPCLQLGRGDAEGAKLTAATATKSVIVSQALIGLGAYTFREPLLQLMTNNTDVINLALTVMPVLTCCFIADGLNVVQGGVLRGAGRQWWTAGLNIAGWWGVGVPLAYYLALVKDFGVPGLWAGFATASALQSALQVSKAQCMAPHAACYLHCWVACDTHRPFA